MKIIIVGCGIVGKTIASELVDEDHEVTMIDNRQAILQQAADSIDAMGIVGNGATYRVLMEAGIQEADLLIAVTGSDELNLLACLLARKVGGCQTIARVRSPEYNEEIPYIRDELGLSMVINPDKEAANEIMRLILTPSAIQADTLLRNKLQLLTFEIPAHSILNGLAIHLLVQVTKGKHFFCAVERGEEILIPSGQTVLKAGDKVSMISEPSDTRDFFLRIGIPVRPIKSCFLAGGSRIAHYLAEQLLKVGIEVKIVEMKADRCRELSEAFPKALILHGDATNKALLQEEGIDRADAVVTLTGIDEENLVLSLYAKKVSNNQAKVLTKINKLPFEEIVNSLNLGSVIYPKYLTADQILRYVRAMQNSYGSNVETLYRIVSNKVEVLEFRARENFPSLGIPLKDMKLRGQLLIGAIGRDRRVFVPNGQDTIEAGDSVVVITTEAGLDDLVDILEEE